MSNNNIIIEAAEKAYRLWKPTSNESVGDKQAAEVTKDWQQRAAINNSIQKEQPIAKHLNEKIDLVDFSTATAYEMKVSSKNPHHEFYKDIFKVIIYNQHNKDNKVKHFVFITGKDGANKLKKGLGKAVIESVALYELSIKVVGI